MSLFGLGDFGEGFVTGLADSASDAIQKDMDAVRARIEKLSDFQANKIIKDQEAREEEIRDAMKQLKRASRVFGNDPNAKKYASAILEREGGIEGLNEVVERFRKAKIANPSLNLGSYFEQSSEELPDLSFREIASSAIPRRTATAVELPEDLAAGGAGNLLTNIGLDQKISQRVRRDVAEQTAAAGIIPTTDTDIVLPSLSFNDEQFLLDTSSVQDSLNYLTRQRALGSNTPERNAEIDRLYEGIVQSAADVGDDINEFNGIQTMLSRLDVTINPDTGLAEGTEDANKYNQLKTREKELQRQMALKKAAGNKKEILLLQSQFAYEDGNTEEGLRLKRLAEDTQGRPLYKTIIERATEDIQRLNPNSPTYADDRAKLEDAITTARANQLNMPFAKDITVEEVTAMRNSINSLFRISLGSSTVLSNLSFENGIPDFDSSYTDPEKKAMAKSEYNRLFSQAIDSQLATVTDAKDRAVLNAVVDNFVAMGMYTTPDPDAGAEVTGAGAEGTDEAVVTMPEIKGVVGEDVSAKQVTDSLNNYPDNTTGVDAFIAAVAGKSEDEVGTIDEQVAGFASLGYSPEFTEELRTKLEKAVPPPPDPKTVQRQEDLEKAIQIIDDTTGFASKEIRTISKEMGITKEAATELHTSAMALKKQRDLDEVESVADDSRTKMANILRNTDDIDQWNRVAAKYMEETGRDMEATKKAFPPPTKKLNRGGLMARQ
tara:strand:+ start:1374 stop:3530 length:2157 start_codon:yes stop_codon:yes gene_type:complete